MYHLVIGDLLGNPIEDLGLMSFEEIEAYALEHYVGEGKLFPDVNALSAAMLELSVYKSASWLIGYELELRITKEHVE